jgi:hypothetical protein
VLKRDQLLVSISKKEFQVPEEENEFTQQLVMTLIKRNIGFFWMKVTLRQIIQAFANTFVL